MAPCLLCGCTCTAPDPTAWLTVRDFAAREGISRATVWRWIGKGLLHVQRIDGRTRVRELDERSWAPRA